MLILSALNITPGKEEADYILSVRVNSHIIWREVLTGHSRSRGAVVLLRRAVNAFAEAEEKGEVEGERSPETESAAGASRGD